MVAVLADAIGRTLWGLGCDLDEGAQCCAPRTCEVHLHRTPVLGDHMCCKHRSCFILQPLLYTAKPSLGVWLIVCLGSESPHRTEGVINLQQQQTSPERAATAAAPGSSLAGVLPGLCFAFLHLSHSHNGPEKRGCCSQSGLDRNRQHVNH